MMSHTTFVIASYAISVLVLAGLIIGILLDGQRQKKRLKHFENLRLAKRDKKTVSPK